MIKRTFALLLAVAMAALLGLLSPGPAAAGSDVPPDHNAPAVLPVADVGTAASPACSAVSGWGKIRYRVCVRYNCDSTSCWVRGYAELTNTATGPRSVYWWLFRSYSEVLDGSGRPRLEAGQQVTVFALEPRHVSCNLWTKESLEINYDGTLSPRIAVEAYMPCV